MACTEQRCGVACRIDRFKPDGAAGQYDSSRGQRGWRRNPIIVDAPIVGFLI